MKFFGNYFGGKKEEIIIDPKFKQMTKDELILTANTLKDANNNLKMSLEELNKSNISLKENILNKEPKTSELKNLYEDIKYTLFNTDSEKLENNSKNRDLRDFIYEQYLLYDGLEEEEINNLNQIKIKEDNWLDNKDFFILKQKVIERNYQDLFKNISIIEELNKLYGNQNKENLDKNFNNDIINESENKNSQNKKGYKNNNYKIKEDNINENKENNKNKDEKNKNYQQFNFLDDINNYDNEEISFNDILNDKKSKWDEE